MIVPTDDQRETLSEWFEALHDRGVEHDFPIEFALTLAGDKPACLIDRTDMVVDRGPFFIADNALSFVDSLGLSTEKRNGFSWYCTRSPDRLDSLSSTGEGDFFGYPEEDIEWFIRTHPDERISPRERVENDDFSAEEMAYVLFLPYLNEDSIEGYERAIENGKRIRQRLAKLSEEWDMPILAEIARDHHEAARKLCAGERERNGMEIKLVCKNPALD